mmetsp:Transcript_9316/g.16811  ORF Transcript_9316/g.16811 Transcript_9316/m.16811 type:complete len:410 (+) Transcript_9316:183-1412(+)
MANAALPPGSHRIWGSANPRNVLGTSSETSGSNSSRVRRLEQHLSNVVFHDDGSSESQSNQNSIPNAGSNGDSVLQVRVKNTFLEFTDSQMPSGMARSRSSGELSRSSQGSGQHNLWDGPSPSQRPSGNNSAGKQVVPPGASTFVDEVPMERMAVPQGVQGLQQMLDNETDAGDDGGGDYGGDTVGVEAEGWSGPLPSIGSELHATGECRPCLYLRAKSGCFNGENCKFCHFSHMKKSRPRPCKAKRAECKRIVAMLDNVFGEDHDSLQKAAERLANESAYMRTVIRGKKNKEMRELLESEHHDEDRGLVPALGSQGGRGGGQQDLSTRAPGGPTSSTARGPQNLGAPGAPGPAGVGGGYPAQVGGGWHPQAMPMSYAGGMPANGTFGADNRNSQGCAGAPPRRGHISL